MKMLFLEQKVIDEPSGREVVIKEFLPGTLIKVSFNGVTDYINFKDVKV